MNKRMLCLLMVSLCFIPTLVLSSHAVEAQEHMDTSQMSDSDALRDILLQLDTSLMIRYIENLTSFGPRKTGTPACDAAAQYLYGEFAEMGLSVRYQNWSVSSSTFGQNIEAILPGVDHESDASYVICGHYDSMPVSPGADDNAGGTAAVLAAAHVMSQYSFNHTVRFVCVSGEEQGLCGSAAYAFEAKEQHESILGVLNADMIGYTDDEESEHKVMVYDNEPSAWITEVTGSISDEYYDVIAVEVVPGGFEGGSDHISFYAVGYEAVCYSEYMFNPLYHSSHDVIETMNPSYAANVSRLMLATLLHLSEYVPQQAPLAPKQPRGTINGKTGAEYQYESTAVDPNDDQVYFLWDFGDGTTSDWVGPYESNDTCQIIHQWSDKGSYAVKVKAKDIMGQESAWSDCLIISMPSSMSRQTMLQKLIISIRHMMSMM